MKKILEDLFSYKTFSYEEAKGLLIEISTGQHHPNQVAAFLAALGMRVVTVDELRGFKDAMLSLCVTVDFSDFDTLDVCGTGGDGKNTFNVSTLTAFVLASLGCKIAKHGNYGVSSIAGSSHIMEHLGCRFTNDQSVLKRSLDQAGICFLHAPLFHPAMKTVAPIRKALAVKTFFNVLGPMVNPSFPKSQLIGVFNLELARAYHYIYQLSETAYSIIYSVGGYDEISLTSDVKLFTNRGEQYIPVKELTNPALGEEKIRGGETVEDSAHMFYHIIQGKGSDAQNAVVAWNAAFAMHTVFPERALDACCQICHEMLGSGKVLKTFNTFISLNR